MDYGGITGLWWKIVKLSRNHHVTLRHKAKLINN